MFHLRSRPFVCAYHRNISATALHCILHPHRFQILASTTTSNVSYSSSFSAARSAYSMAGATASPFTNAVVNAMRKLYPEELADASFDNTGLLLEAPFDPRRRQRNSVLLTVDLTKAVADEAIRRRDSIVVAYHPIIFRGLKSLTLADTQQQSLLRLAREGISVYCPHTAVDASPEGLGAWLADVVTSKVYTSSGKSSPTRQSTKASILNRDPKRQYFGPFYPVFAKADNDLRLSQDAHILETIHPNKAGPPGTGMGRLVKFNEPQPLASLVERIARGTGTQRGLAVAMPQGQSMEDINIRTVAVCAGSGGSVFKGADADLLFTGELSHHEALAATEQGKCVVTLFHSNTERRFLHNVMKPRLLEALVDEWTKARGEEAKREDHMDSWKDAIEDETIEIEVSEVDRDPYGIVSFP